MPGWSPLCACSSSIPALAEGRALDEKPGEGMEITLHKHEPPADRELSSLFSQGGRVCPLLSAHSARSQQQLCGSRSDI